MNCSIVIRAYNEADHLPRLFEGLARQTISDAEIILVDSGSTDATIQIAEQHGARIVHIPSKEFTFGRSLNLGLQAATHELVVIASAHIYPVYADWLESLLRPFEDPAVALSYGKQRGPQTAKFSEQQIYLHWYPDVSQPHQPTAFCNNANAAVRRSLWMQHPYDETLTGLEDLEWSQWAKSQGHEIAYVSEAEIIHIHNETPQGILNRYRREAMAFKKIFPEAHFSIYDFLRLTLTNILSDGWHALRQRMLLKNLVEIIWFRLMQFHGTRLGHRATSLLTPQLRETFYYARSRVSKAENQRDVEPLLYRDEADNC